MRYWKTIRTLGVINRAFSLEFVSNDTDTTTSLNVRENLKFESRAIFIATLSKWWHCHGIKLLFCLTNKIIYHWLSELPGIGIQETQIDGQIISFRNGNMKFVCN